MTGFLLLLLETETAGVVKCCIYSYVLYSYIQYEIVTATVLYMPVSFGYDFGRYELVSKYKMSHGTTDGSQP